MDPLSPKLHLNQKPFKYIIIVPTNLIISLCLNYNVILLVFNSGIFVDF